MPSRCVVLLLDGLGDRSFASLGHKTPLQAAHTPNLDALAERGANGLFHAGTLGKAFSSQDAHFSLFGYTWEERPRRSILEAVGAGIQVGRDEVAVLARIVSAEDAHGVLKIVDRVPRATHEELVAVMNEVENYEARGIGFRFIQTGEPEGLLIMRGSVSHLITDTDPFGNDLPAAEVKPLVAACDEIAARDTALALKEYLRWTFRKLSDHPVNRARAARGAPPLNAFVTHLADRPRPVVSFKRRWGLKGLFISSKLVEWGLSEALGMDTYKVKSSDDPARDLAERIAIARESVPDYDYIHIHTLAPDEAAHTKDPVRKKQVIERLDSVVGDSAGPLLNDPDVLLVVTSDHSTPSLGPLIHSGEPVPLTMVGEGLRVDSVRSFNEIDCAGGALGAVRGGEFMFLILNYLDRCKLNGIMNSPEDQHYWPADYEPFLLSD